MCLINLIDFNNDKMVQSKLLLTSSNKEWISISIKKSKKFMMIDLKELNTKEQYQEIYLIAKSLSSNHVFKLSCISRNFYVN